MPTCERLLLDIWGCPAPLPIQNKFNKIIKTCEVKLMLQASQPREAFFIGEI